MYIFQHREWPNVYALCKFPKFLPKVTVHSFQMSFPAVGAPPSPPQPVPSIALLFYANFLADIASKLVIFQALAWIVRSLDWRVCVHLWHYTNIRFSPFGMSQTYASASRSDLVIIATFQGFPFWFWHLLNVCEWGRRERGRNSYC